MTTNVKVKDAKNQLRIGQATLKNQNRPSKQSQLYLQQQEGLFIQQGSDEQQMGKGENMYGCMRLISGTLINLRAKNSRLYVLNKKVQIPPYLSGLYDKPGGLGVKNHVSAPLSSGFEMLIRYITLDTTIISNNQKVT